MATFLSQSFAQLQPDSAAQAVFVGNQTVYLLARLVSANDPTFAVPNPDISSSNPFDFQVPRSAIVLNSLWFLSLVIALVCTLLATLVQEWSRDFQRASSRRFSDKTVKEAAFNHIYQRMGVDRFGLDYMTSLIVGLIHVAVILFLIGLAIFLFPVHHVPAWVVIIFSAVAAAFYVVASIIPVFAHDCPYCTWLTPVFGRLCWILYTLTFLIWNLAHKSRRWHQKDRKMNLSICLGLIKGVSKYTYEIFDSDVDWVFMRDLPQDIKIHPIVKPWLGSRTTDWNSFMNGSRLAFVWERMSGYLLLDQKENKDAIGALLDHLPRQIKDSDIKDVSPFIVHLRRRERFMEPLMHRMSEVNSVATAVGSLTLLKVLVDADSPDADMYDYLGNHWTSMERTIAAHFPRILERIEQVNKDALRGNVGGEAPLVIHGDSSRRVDLSVLIAVTKLRSTLLKKRNKVLLERRAHEDDYEMRPSPRIIDETRRLDLMLRCIDDVKSFRLLRLARPSNAQASIEAGSTMNSSEKTDLENVLSSYRLPSSLELTVRNKLTLLAYVVCSEVHFRRSTPDASSPPKQDDEHTGKPSLVSQYLSDWIQKHGDENKPKDPDTIPASSAEVAYLCNLSIDELGLGANVEWSDHGPGRVTGFDVLEATDGRKGIRDMLDNLVHRVSVPRPPNFPVVDQLPEGLRILQELFSAPM